MNHITSIGLDVHARSITACAFNPMTGEVVTQRFNYDPASVAEWILSFESPKAVYESGVTGFNLCRSLRSLGVDCVVGAVSKMQRPAAGKRVKNDVNDAEFLARLLSTHNVVEVMVPDKECESERDLARLHEDVRKNLCAARQRLTNFLLRKGYVFNEKTPTGLPKVKWGQDHWAWIEAIRFEEDTDNFVLDHYISDVHHIEAKKKQIEARINKDADQERWKARINALRCLKGIETLLAFTLVVEADVFSRFKNATAFSSWLGLVPSDHSSGETVSHGGITKCGNSLVRRMLIEAAWTYARATRSRKKAPDPATPADIQAHASEATKRLVRRRRNLIDKGKKPVVANAAVARELACFVWSIGCMAEGVRL